ncbi:uncharacterized protein LOC104878643 [Vitis vinifera]|uniref:uncharacterized protein LOC104878643 n=1 Tax=Vitis vinifera TaxID=29760 RepID=UPI002882F5D5|nr:uncharacterized protein LOC104878643 [Vitis vinifera]
MAHKSDPFILASQAKQVFYVQDQLDPRWSVVLSTPERDFSFSAKDSDDFMDNSIEHHPLITTLAQVESFDTMDDSDVICIRGDYEPKLLKKPPAEYHFIDDEDWNIFVKNRLSEKFQEYREAQKQRRKKHIYNHHLSRKGYAGLEEEMMIEAGSTESIDRSLLWKRAMQKKDGSYDDVVLPVVEKIDELMKESQESGISYSGSNDILSQALGTPEYTGRVRAKGKHYTPGRYFNSMSERVVRDILKATQERQAKFEADVLARLSQIGVATPQSDVSSSNMKSKLLLLPEVVEKPIRKVEEETLPVKIEPHMKARKCELAVGTRENTVAGGTIVMDCGPNYLVVLDAPYESNTPLPIPIHGQATTVGAAVGYQGSQKGKRQKTTENDLKIGENPQDINNFDALVGLMLNEGKAQGVEVPNDVFGESFKTFLMKEDMDMIISFKEVSANRVIYYIW